eukprot:g4872.t1
MEGMDVGMFLPEKDMLIPFVCCVFGFMFLHAETGFFQTAVRKYAQHPDRKKYVVSNMKAAVEGLRDFIPNFDSWPDVSFINYFALEMITVPHHSLGAFAAFLGFYWEDPFYTKVALCIEFGGMDIIHFGQMLYTIIRPPGVAPFREWPTIAWVLLLLHHTIGTLGFIVECYLYPISGLSELREVVFLLLFAQLPDALLTPFKMFGSTTTASPLAKFNTFLMLPVSIASAIYCRFYRYVPLIISLVGLMEQHFGKNVANFFGFVCLLFITFSAFALFMMISDLYEALRMFFSGKSIEKVARAASRSRGLSAVTRGGVVEGRDGGKRPVDAKKKA